MVVRKGYVSDETMGTIAPIVVYWVYAGVYQFLSRSLDKFRLHSLDEEHGKNIVPILTVVRGVLLQQLLQVSVTQFGFLITSYAEETLKPMVQPSVPIQTLQILLAIFIFNTCQYFVHRYMHLNKFLYRYVHSYHHRLIVPYAVGALYNHPVEALFDMLGGAAAFFADAKNEYLVLLPPHCQDSRRSLRHDVHHQINGVKYNYSQPFSRFGIE